MNNSTAPTDEEVERRVQQLEKDASYGGYYLNPDVEFTKKLVRGLMMNEQRYTYPACPCRLASGKNETDLDIICPCDYRDPDLDEYGTCYCALYVSEEINKGKSPVGSIPERRPPRSERGRVQNAEPGMGKWNVPLPVWRCRVCGYLCARESPPLICPICKVKKDRFERFL
jgi:ferredoxin-thioredoxin reductase catalytic chain